MPRGTPALVVALYRDILRLILLKNACMLAATLHRSLLLLILPEMWRWRRARSALLGVKSRRRPL